MDKMPTIHYVVTEAITNTAVYAQAVGTAITLQKDLQVPIRYYGLYRPREKEQIQRAKTIAKELSEYGIHVRLYPNPRTFGKIRMGITAIHMIYDVKRALVNYPGIVLVRGISPICLVTFLNKKFRYVIDLRAHRGAEREASGSMRRKSLSGKLFYLWEKFVLKHADAIFCVSNPLVNYVQQLDSNIHPCYVIPSCLSIPQIQRLNEDNIKFSSIHIEKNSLVLVYVGTLNNVWNCLEPMLILFNYVRLLIPNSKFLCLTPDKEVALSTLSKTPIPEYLYEIDHVTNADMMSVLRQRADIGLLLRDNSMVNQVASPVKVGEYLAAGLPIIATDNIGDTSTILNSEQSGFILPSLDPSTWDIDSLGDFVKEVLQNRQLYRNRAINTAKRYFDRRNYLDVYRKVFLET
jgi:glycosyltransferase involved in cell wall biosynthesis